MYLLLDEPPKPPAAASNGVQRLYGRKVDHDELIRALEDRRPKPRYFVTTPTYLMGFLRRALPTRALDWLIAKG